MALLRKLILVLVFAALMGFAISFTQGNESSVSVELFGVPSPQLPLWAVLGVTYTLGVISAGALLTWSLMRRSLEVRRHRKTVAGLESEVHQLRNLPLEGADAVGVDPALGTSADPSTSEA